MSENSTRMDIRHVVMDAVTILIGAYLILNSISWVNIIIGGHHPIPEYDYHFPGMGSVIIISSLIACIFLFSYILRPNRITKFIQSSSKLNLNKKNHGLLYIILIVTFWFMFGIMVANGIASFEIRWILGEEVILDEVTNISIIGQQLLMLFPFVFLPIIWVKLVNNGNFKQALGLTSEKIAWNLVLGFLVALATLLIIPVVNLIFVEFFGFSDENILLESMLELGPLMAIFISVSAGVTEEIFFRGFIQTRSSILIAATLFAITHAGYGIMIQIIGPFIFGLIVGILYEKTDSLVGPITAHSVYNIILIFALMYLF